MAQVRCTTAGRFEPRVYLFCRATNVCLRGLGVGAHLDCFMSAATVLFRWEYATRAEGKALCPGRTITRVFFR